ncbi:MAG: PAS domain S-box protein [Armatimonadetes bacterium]|nr:PAS domain S-box protein [Armatimonadota bacterium]
MKAPFPANEANRLAALLRYGVLDTDAEQSFDDLTALAAQICGTPIALITLVDAERLWFKSNIGMNATEISRDIAFCAHAILTPDDLFVVPDTLLDERFATNPLVVGETNIRFYAGAPIVTPDGYALGNLCVLDCVPRTLTPQQQSTLQKLSRQAINLLELRLNLSELHDTHSLLRESEHRYRMLVELSGDMVTQLEMDGTYTYASPATRAVVGYEPEEIVGKNAVDFLHPDDLQRMIEVYERGEGSEDLVQTYNYRFRHREGHWVWLETASRVVLQLPSRYRRIVATSRDITSGIEAEQTLRESEEQYRSVVSALIEGVMLIAGSGEIMTCNAAAEAILTTSSEHLLGRNIFTEKVSHIHEDGSPFCIEEYPAYITATTGESCTNVVMGLSHPEKGMIWLSLNSLPVMHAGTTAPYTAVVSFTDITERKRSEDEMRASEERYKYLVDHASDIIYRANAEGEFTFVNPTAVRVLGFQLDELIGKHYMALVAPAHRDGAKRFYLKQFITRTLNTYYEFPCIAHDGRTLWFGQNVHLILEGGRIAGFQAVARDITERKQVEEALRESEALFHTAFDSAPIGMALVSIEGHWLQVNRALCQIVGYSEEELLQTNFQSITHTDDLEPQMDLLYRTLIGELPGYQMEKRYIHKQGYSVWTQLSVSIVRDPQSKPLYFISQIQDITAQRQTLTELAEARDAALESTRLKSQFLANMSHEIRTPMNGIIGMADLLMTTRLEPEQRQFASTIQASALDLLTILNDILDFSKIEAGKVSFENIPFSLRGALTAITQLLWPRANAKGIHLAFSIAPDVPDRLMGDPVRLRQVLNNLLNNAIKFTAFGEVVVRVMMAEEQPPGAVTVRFQVSDTGIGISSNVLPQLFTPFNQADNSTTRKYGGTGLGLAICQQLVELMGGTIGVQSQSGIGSTFWFVLTFPLASEAIVEAHHPPPALQYPEREEQALHNASTRILVAEDNPINQRVTVGQLARLGFQADVVSNGVEALDALSRTQYDLVFMDCQMPEMDGYQASREIRRREGSRRTTIIALTAGAMQGVREECLAAGMDDYIAKPVQLEKLQTILDQWVGPPRFLAAATVSGKNAESIADAAAPPPLDSEVIESLRALGGRDGKGILEELIDLFRADVPVALAELRDALKSDETLCSAGRISHRIKGSSAILGAGPLTESLHAMEEACRRGERATALQLLPKVEAHIAAVIQALKREQHR